MAQDGMTWAETLQYSAEQKLLAKQLYLVFRDRSTASTV